jgi:hypothetical protein
VAQGRLAPPASEEDRRANRTGGGEGEETGARAHAHYRDRHEEYVLVTRDDLREIKAFGWLQQALLTIGTFFFSGAFWLLAELAAHQETEGKSQITSWMGMCVASMIFGISLIIVAVIFYALKQKRLNKYLVEK